MGPNDMLGIYTNQYPKEYEKYSAQYGGQIEAIGWKWWDTQTYVSGTTTQLTNYFNVRATPDLSNMEVAFQLAAPKAFLIRSIRFFLKLRPRAITIAANGAVQPGALDNLAQLGNTGVFTLTIGNKVYNNEPVWCMTSGGGAVGVLAHSSSQVLDWGTMGVADPRAVNTLSKPIFIPPQMNFNGLLNWPAAITLEGGDTAIQLLLDGDLLRPVQ